MKKELIIVPLLLFGGIGMRAEGEQADSVRVEQLEEAVVKAVRAGHKTPVASSRIGSEQLQEFSRTGQELPFLLSRTPGIIAWSENGLGSGTSYMRIRGAGDSRINVTIDGVPLNSPEDQCVFWANMNNYSTMLSNVQIQRGVGTSSSGDGAFGGSISLSTAAPALEPGVEIEASYGTYNTHREGVSFSTGLGRQNVVIDGSYHQSSTDGYIHGTAGRSGSYHGGISWLPSSAFSLKFKHIGNFEKTGQAWNGVVAGDYDGYVNLNEAGVKSYKDLYKMGLGRYNTLCENVIFDENGKFVSASPYKFADGRKWKQTTDNFWQHHNILTGIYNISQALTLTATVHYTHGHGYYEEFRHNNKLKKYGLPNYVDENGSTIKKQDFVRKKGLVQDECGALANLSYVHGRWDVVGGVSYQHFNANHYGYLSYMSHPGIAALYLSDGDWQYYDSDAWKNDFSVFAKATYTIANHWNVFADLQYRFVSYRTDGYNDKYHDDLSKHILDIDKKWNFFNPKAGISYTCGGHKAYASVSNSHREPERNNFTDNGSYPSPKAESLIDFELGYEFEGKIWHAGANLYYMDYVNQFVQTGAVSDIGEALTANIKSSYRLGAEISAGVNPTSWLSIEANAAFSSNRIKDFDEVVTENYDADWNPISDAEGNPVPHTAHYSNSTLAYSPSVILNGFITAHYKGFRASWHTGYVSRQYLDNTQCMERSLPGYSNSELSAEYTFTFPKFVKSVTIGVNVGNVFNSHFAASGFIWYQSIVGGTRHAQLSYIPSSGTTCLASIKLKF